MSPALQRSSRDIPRSANRLALLAVACIVLLAGVLRFWAIDSGLPNQQTRPDELPVVLEMARPARGDFSLELTIYPSAYIYASWLWVEAGLRVAPLFGVDPPGGYQKTLLLEPELLFLIGRTASAFAGTIAVLLVLWLARREFGWGAALSSGLLAAVCLLHVRDSHALKPDAFLSVATLLALAAMLPLARNATPLRGAISGAAVGLAMACKLPGVLMLAPLYVAAVLGSGNPPSGGLGKSLAGWRRVVPVPALVGGLAAAAVFALSSPYMVFGGELLDQTRFIVQMIFPAIFGDPAAGALAAPGALDFRPPAALALERYGSGAWWDTFAYHVRFSLWYGMGAFATVLAPFAIAFGLASREPLARLAAVTCLVNYLVVGLSPALTSRYVTSFMPVLALLEGGLLAFLAARLTKRLTTPALVLLTLAAIAQPLAASIGHNRIAQQTDTRVLASRWLAEHASEGDHVKYLGNVLMPYGQPAPPAGVRAVLADPTPRALSEAGVDWVVTHDHVLYYSSVIPEEFLELEPHLSLAVDFDPSSEHPERAVFEANDAYYIPVAGFSGVLRPGPRVRIYRFTPAAGQTSTNE